jgi:hypothetical protein
MVVGFAANGCGKPGVRELLASRVSTALFFSSCFSLKCRKRRVLPARDEIFSKNQLEHSWVWLNFLRPELPSRYYLGIRPVSDSVRRE